MEEIYMEAPEGALSMGNEGKVCRLVKGLYGLKQAGRAWYLNLCHTFTDLTFTHSHADHSIFIRTNQMGLVIITVSTDDMTITRDSLHAVKAFKAVMAERYEIMDLGEISWLLGFQVTRDRHARTLTLSQ